jgi:hypothetical protein
LPNPIVYFDDDPEDLPKYASMLKEKLGSEIIQSKPPPDLNLEYLPQDVDMLVVDYDLAQKQEGGKPAPYKGGTLAALLRERYPDAPIVILSRPMVFHDLGISPDQLVAADTWFFKHEFVENTQVASSMLSLKSGFAEIRSTPTRDWAAIRALLKANDDEIDVLKEAGPHFVTKDDAPPVWTPHDLAAWIRKIVLNYPGVVYSPLFASTTLGVEVGEFLSADVQSIFREARYDGVFSGQMPQWWAGRLVRGAKNLISASKVQLPLIPGFLKAFTAVYNRSLKQAVCISSGESPADSVCYIFGAPVMRKHSLEYYPDNRPSIMEPARVSFRAIREKNSFKEEFLTDSGREVLGRIQE